jgi:DNA repair protein RecO
MSHHIYTTRGLILSLRKTGETDKLVYVFTRDLGLVLAHARGVRKIGSKLSSSLSELSIVDISLVRGKRYWRVTSVVLIQNLPFILRERREALAVLYKVTGLLSRLIHGEEKSSHLYDELEAAIIELIKIEGDEVGSWEIYTISKILFHLGYLSKSDVPSSVDEALLRKNDLVRLINTGIRESGLE